MKLSEITNGTPQRIKLSQLSDAPSGGSISSIPKTENIFQKITSAITSLSPQAANPQHPFQSGIGATTQGLKQVPGLSGYMQGHEAKSGVINDAMPGNPVGAIATDFISDPETWIGANGLAEGAKNTYKNIKNPSKFFGEGIDRLQSKNPSQRVDFFKIINDSLSDPKASKVLEKSGVLDRFGGTRSNEFGTLTDRLSELTLQDSQDLVNSLKDGVRQAVKEGTVKPSERGIAKMFSELSKAQKSSFQGFDKVARDYGVGKNLGKFASSASKRFINGLPWGAGVGASGGVIYNALKKS